ncbi:hypothetical protein ACROYT_G007250 [Oculina patagonica]
MENLLRSSSKTRSIEIPVANMISPESEISSGNTMYTRPNSIESALPRIKSAFCPGLPDKHMQQVRSKSFSFSVAGKEMRKSEDGLELPDVQKSKYLVSFSDLEQTEKTSTAKDAGFPERPFKVSKLLQDRIRVLEDEVQKHLVAAKETISQAEMDGKQERATASGSQRERSVKGSHSGKDSTKSFESESFSSEEREKDGKSPDGKLNRIVKEGGLPSKSILKERKHGSSKPDNLTKTVNKTIRQLYKLNKVNEAESLSDLLESKLMTEKELNKAIKRELQEEREEKKRMEAKNFEKSRREAFFLKMEELERLEEEMRETRMREREKRRAEAQKRREKNIALWNEKQKSILSSKISRAFKFSYFPLLIHDTRSSSSDEQSSSEDSDSSSSDSTERVSRQNSACTCASSSNKRKNCSSHSRKKKINQPR